MPVDPAQEPTADFTPEGAELQEEQRRVAYAAEPPSVAARPTPDRLAAAGKDAAIASLIAVVLAGPIVGLRTESAIGGLSLTQNWPTVLVIVAAVFFGRMVLTLFVWNRLEGTLISRLLKPSDWIVIVASFGILVWHTYTYGGDYAYGFSANAVLLVVLIVAGALLRNMLGVDAYVGRLIGQASTSAFPWAAFLGGLAVAAAIAFPLIPSEGFFDFFGGRRYVMDQAIVILTYIMLAWGLNIVVGFAGLLDLGYVAFYAVGAYSFALIATNFELGFWVSLPMAGLLAAGWGLILGFPVLRLRGDYLAIVTLAFGEIIRLVLLNWYDLTNGPDGVSGIPRPTLFGIEFSRDEGGFADVFGLEYTPLHRIIYLFYIILALALITSFITQRLRRLPIGRAWEALREDEIACRSLGINTTNTKLTAFACGAFFGGLAGSFFATRQGFISPESFTALESFIILALVVLGGLGSQIGIVIAAIFLNTVFELRGLEQYRMLIVGLSMVLVMVWRPRGLIATRAPSIFLKKPTSVSGELVGEGRG